MNNLDSEEKSLIWFPHLYIKNTMYRVLQADDPGTNVFVRRGSLRKPNSVTEHQETVLHSGEDSDIVLLKVIDTSIQCNFDLHDFPFDTQWCSIDVDLADLYKEKIKLNGDNVLQFTSLSINNMNLNRIQLYLCQKGASLSVSP